MNDQALEGLAMLLLVVCLMIAIATAYAIWYVIAACIAAWRFQRYLERARENYQKVAAELGADATEDSMYEMLGAMGLEVDRESHYASEADYYSAVYFGVEEAEVKEKGA